MEDGLERNLFNYNNENTQSIKHLYACISNENAKILAITFNKQKAIQINEQTKCIIKILKCKDDVYYS